MNMFAPGVPPEAVEREGAVRAREIDAAVQHHREVHEAREAAREERQAARAGRTSAIRTALLRFLRR